MAEKVEVDKTLFWCAMHELCSGLVSVECYSTDVRSLLGLVWGYYQYYGKELEPITKKKFYGMGSYVIDSYRRQGVRTAINEYLFRVSECDMIVTECGTSESGLGFLEGSGYRFNEETGLWYLTKEMFEAKQNEESQTESTQRF